MSFYEIKKVENCISKSAVYQYRFNFKISEEFIRCFENPAEITFNKNFPKPSFSISYKDGSRIIGVIRDVAFKAMFPVESAEDSKNRFELILDEIAESYKQET